jgi:predicted SprT family Zn-dependent metalloprotease
MSTKLLLSPELRAKVLDVVEDAYCLAELHYGIEFKRPEVRFDLHNTNGGEAWYARNLLRYNLTFLVENEEIFLATTTKHEPAHLIAHALHPGKKIRSHGAEWREVMELFGLAPAKNFIKHTYPITSLDRHPRHRARLQKSLRQKLKVERLVAEVNKLTPELREQFDHLIKI